MPSASEFSYNEQRQQFPPRGGSIQPLNTSFIRTDSAPPQGLYYGGPPNAPPRTGTAGPNYPLPGGRPGPKNGLAAGPLSPPRSSSAAGYGPQPRPLPGGVPQANRSSSSSLGSIPPAGTYIPPRAGTAMGLMNNAPPQQGPYRRPSGPHAAPPGPGRQHYPGPHGHPQGHPPNTYPPDNQYGQAQDPKHRPPPVDIGFEAPIKPPRSPAPRAPTSPPQGPGHGGRLPVNNAPPTPMTPGLNNRPMGLPTSPSPGGGSWAAPPQPAAAPSQLQESAPKPSTPKPTQPSKPPAAGKGPKSFEEMGVPSQTQKEQDCVSITPT